MNEECASRGERIAATWRAIVDALNMRFELLEPASDVSVETAVQEGGR